MSETSGHSRQFELRALERQNSLTKPQGSLGRLEAVAVQMAAFQKTDTPEARPAVALIFAADHPVTKHGISAYPSEVTGAMLANFQAGGAAASVLAREAGIALHVQDVGVNGKVACELPAGDIRVEDALSPEIYSVCVCRGAESFRALAGNARVVIFGEMGIGNTTPAAAIAAWVVGAVDPTALVGAGTGATGVLLDRKKQVVREVVARICSERTPEEVLRRAGGRELAALFGAISEAIRGGCVVLIDGFIVTAVAALVVASQPCARRGMIFAHRSEEQGHEALLQHLNAEPLLDLGLRLGEASGALLAYSLLERACALHNTMATFSSADIPEGGS